MLSLALQVLTLPQLLGGVGYSLWRNGSPMASTLGGGLGGIKIPQIGNFSLGDKLESGTATVS